MSDQGMEMQFAEPDWQPASSQTISSTGEESRRKTGQERQTHRRRTTSRRLENRSERQAVTSVARLALVVIWFATPLIARAFHGGWIVPLLGILFLPLTTFTYTIVFAITGNVAGLAWLWVIGALLLDLASYGGRSNKRKSGS